MAFQSLVEHLRAHGKTRLFRVDNNDPLNLAVRHYKSASAPRLVISLSREAGEMIKLKKGTRVDVMFDPVDCTGLVKLRPDGYTVNFPEQAKRYQIQMPFIPLLVPDFGEQGYSPEEVGVKDEGLLFAFPRELYTTGRNGIRSVSTTA